MLWPSPLVSMHRRLSRCAAASLSRCPVASLVPLSPRQRLSHCTTLAPAVGCCIVTYLVVPSPLSLRRHLSLSSLSRCAATSLSRASLVAPPPLSLDATSPLSLRRRLYRHANACLIAPLSRQRLVVASSPLSPRQCLSCCDVASLVVPPPLSLSMRRRLSRCAAASIATPTPVSLRLSRASGWLLNRHLSRRASASLVVPSLRYLSNCAAVSLGHDPLNPSKKSIGLLGGSSSINPTQRHETKGLMWGA